nr:hypothetical protein [Bacillus weihaiensis]
MIKKILKSILSSSKPTQHRRSYSSSDVNHRKYGKPYHPSRYGHQYYKKKHKSSSRFSRSYSS